MMFSKKEFLLCNMFTDLLVVLQDLTIARKADIELKTKELLEMQGLLAVKDRCIDMLCEKVESARALSPKLEHHASGIDGTPENREHRPGKSFFVDGDVMGKKRVECVDPSIVPQSSLSCTTVAQPNRVSVGKTVLSVDALASTLARENFSFCFHARRLTGSHFS